MTETAAQQKEDQPITFDEYIECLSRVGSRAVKPLSEKITAQVIAFASSLILFLGKISIGYFAIDKSAPLEEQQLSIILLFEDDTACLIAFLALTLTTLLFVWRMTYNIFLNRIRERKFYNADESAFTPYRANITFQLAQIGILVAAVLAFFVRSPSGSGTTTIELSVGYALFATLICIFHVRFLHSSPKGATLHAKKSPRLITKKFLLVITPIAIVTIAISAIPTVDRESILLFFCFLYFAYQSIWLVAYGVWYKATLNSGGQNNPHTAPNKEKTKLKMTFPRWLLATAMVAIILFMPFLGPIITIIDSFTKALAGVIALAYQLPAFLKI